MSKYTAGPWKAYANAEFSGSEDYPFLVALDYGVGPTNPNVMGCRMSEANAHLIAAAPELLEALKEITAIMHQLGHKDTVCVLDARAAIAKAEQP